MDDSEAKCCHKGALKQAQTEQANGKGTTIDDKILRQRASSDAIRARLAGRGAGRAAVAQVRQGQGRRGQQQRQQHPAVAADSERDEELSAEEDSEDDSDVPLPGELDDEDEEDVGDGAELGSGSEDDASEGDLEGESDAEQMSDGEPADDSSKAQQQQQAVPGKRKQLEQAQQGGRAAASQQAKQQREKLQQQQQQQARRQQRRPEQEASDGEQGSEDEEDEGQQRQPAKRQRGAGGKANGFYAATPEGTTFSAQSFADLNLSRPLVKACQALGYASPTPIQAACIPLALTGRDICGSAVTGSGKTAAFSLPLLERLLHRDRRVGATYVLVLAPTRELAVQVHSMITRLGQFTDIRAALVVGGLSLNAQAAELKSYPEIVVATPGRMIDHLRNTQNIGLEDLQALVLDEADRLLEMGFAEEIREIVKMAPVRRQTMLFSATMTEEVKRLIALSLKHPVRLAADPTAAAPQQLTQEIVRLKGGQAAHKEAMLLSLCARTFNTGRTIVFFQTKQKAHRLKILFGLAGLPPAAELHGDMTQAARLESLERFRKGEAAYLLATDVAARGLDILGVETVINFDCPAQLASYLHRVGRTARAGNRGRAITFVEDGDRALLKEVIKKTKVQMQQRQVPAHAVASWQDKVERLEEGVFQVIAEEREERALRKAEMEAQKALNMVEHEDEIRARPARTWFQTERQKREVAQKSKAAALAGGREGEGEGDPRDKKQDGKAARKEKLKQKAAKQTEDKKRKNPLMDETVGQKRTIKSIKAREAELRQQGVSAARAGKIAAGMVTGVKSKKQKKRKAGEKGGENGGGDGGLFGGDGIGKPSASGPSKVYAGGAKSGKLKIPKAVGALSKVELARAKRGGKGKHGFKSKARHKRR
ncbi:hypothetical protein N2152v2_008546 [Parachlorella kessleri]